MMSSIKQVICAALLVAFLAGGLPVFAAEQININTATVEQLVEVKGIGEVLAQRIIEYRQSKGDFTSLDELQNVKGVGGKTLEKLRPHLVLSEG